MVIPWARGAITVRGRNKGPSHLTVCRGKTRVNLIDFLFANLMAYFTYTYEEIVAFYEAKLRTGKVTDYGFPPTYFPKVNSSLSLYTAGAARNDKKLIEVLMREYYTYIEYLNKHFEGYKSVIDFWYTKLPATIKKKENVNLYAFR
jgi:hypothetical protein